MKAFLERASEGDEGTRSKIREMMSCESDELVRIFGGDVAWTAEKAGVRTAAGKNVAIQEAMHRKLADLRAALAGPSPTPVEMVLAERIAACWFVLNQFEVSYQRQLNQLSFSRAEGFQTLIDRAHRRLMSAVKTLATVRKLAVPAIQVNIGQAQTNVAGGPSM